MDIQGHLYDEVSVEFGHAWQRQCGKVIAEVELNGVPIAINVEESLVNSTEPLESVPEELDGEVIATQDLLTSRRCNSWPLQCARGSAKERVPCG